MPDQEVYFDMGKFRDIERMDALVRWLVEKGFTVEADYDAGYVNAHKIKEMMTFRRYSPLEPNFNPFTEEEKDAESSPVPPEDDLS